MLLLLSQSIQTLEGEKKTTTVFELKSSDDKHFFFLALFIPHRKVWDGGWIDKAGRGLAFILASVQTMEMAAYYLQSVTELTAER